MKSMLLPLVEKVYDYVHEVDDSVGACEVAVKFKIRHSEALEILKKLHADGRLGCPDGCEECEPEEGD